MSVPADTAVTNPPPVTVALLLRAFHTPPEAVSVNISELPMHKADTPPIVPAIAVGYTSITSVATAEPQLAVTV
jgi:hypothetical protein